MFQRLYVDNYKCLVNFELRLQELSLLVGRNGVGKSSVLDVVFALRQLLSGVAKVTDPGILPTSTLTRWQSRDVQVFETEVALGEDVFVYRLEVEHQPQTRRARIILERLTLDDKPLFRMENYEVHLYRDDHSEGPVFSADWSESALARVASRDDNTKLTRFLDFVRKVVVCAIYPASFAAECITEDALLDRDARNFAAWYRQLVLEHQDLVPGFIDALAQVVDGLASLRLEKVGQDARALLVRFQERDSRYELRLDEISDGQRALIALYALVRLTRWQGATLFLDEPDNYVALAEIQPWLVELSDACGDSIPQAVLCSHHPELIDYLGGARGILLEREVSGVTTVRGLAETTEPSGLKLSELVARGWER